MLRRVEIGVACFALAESATWLAMLVFAFERGGTREAGTIAVMSLVCAVIVAPFAAYSGDRFPANRALTLGFICQALTMGASAMGMSSGNAVAAYGGVIAVAGAVTFTRPTVASLLPTVTHTPKDLVAANAVMNLVANGGIFVAPLLAAVLLTIQGPALVFGVCGGLTAVAALLSAGVAVQQVTRTMTAATLRTRVLGGIDALAHEPTLRVLVIIMSLSAFFTGVIDVLVVTVAEERFADRINVGILAAAVGLGAVIGVLFTSWSIGRYSLARLETVGVLAMVVPMVVVVSSGDPVVVVLALGCAGVGQSAILVAGSVALQRWAPDDVLARIFGIHESSQMLAMALGATAFTTLAQRASLTTTVVIIGAAVFLVAGLSISRLMATGADVPPPAADLIERLHADPIFAPLDVRAMERLAKDAERRTAPAGESVIVQGAVGDRYFLVVTGSLLVSVNAQPVGPIGPGAAFGEIALLRDVPRTATIVATEESELISIARESFLEAVTGHPQSSAAADGVVAGYL